MALPLDISETQRLQFIKHIKSFAPVPDDDLDKLVSLLSFKSLSKDEFILKEGSVCKNFYFVLKGLLRGYEIFKEKEVNVEFYFENHIAADFYSLRNETPSQQFLVTMEPCEILYAAKEDYLPVFLQSAPLTFVSMRLFQNMFLEEEAYSTMFKKLTSEERYQYVLEHRPKLIQRIPINQLASYLGMSRESLSRIRSRINR